MRIRHPILPLVSLAVLTCCSLSLWGQTTIRTIAYHQLTQFQSPPVADLPRAVAISGDGRKLAFARGYYYADQTNRIYTINFDGTGLKLVDVFQGTGGSPEVGMSHDGSKVMWTDGNGLVRLVDSEGGAAQTVVQVQGGFHTFRLSGDGSKVFFMVDRDFSIAPYPDAHPAGVYKIEANGSGLQHIAGAAKVASYYGVTQDKVSLMLGSSVMAVSGDGLRLLFRAELTNAVRLMAINADGSGLHELSLAPTAFWHVPRCALSYDGSKAAYHIHYSPCCSSGEEFGVINWDGSGRVPLLDKLGVGYGVYADPKFSLDGTKVLFGETGYLFNTDGSGTLELDVLAPYATAYLLNTEGGFMRATMNDDATRFGFLSTVGVRYQYELATAELNPTNLRSAPLIQNASVSPAYFALGASSYPILKASPMLTNGLVYNGGMQASMLRNGVADPAFWTGSTLHDDGLWGDAVAQDGIYSDNNAHFWDPPVVGPRTVRFKAEVLGADGLYHATAIDTAPFFVVTQAPTSAPPAIVSITPSNAIPGSAVSIAGTGFDPVASNNVVLFGNVPAQVISGNSQGTQLIVIVPAGVTLPASVTVSSQGQTSTGFTFGGGGGDWLVAKQLAGVEIHGTVGRTYRVEYQSDLSDTNSWVGLTNIVLTTDPYFWVDLSSVDQPKRFYRTVRLP